MVMQEKNMVNICVKNSKFGSFVAENIVLKEDKSICLEGDKCDIEFYKDTIIFKDPNNENIKYREVFLCYVEVNGHVVYEDGCLDKIEYLLKKWINDKCYSC